MLSWAKFFIQVCFLRAAPQDAPGSKSIRNISIAVYFAIGMLVSLHTQPLLPSLFVAFMQTLILVFITNLLLLIRKTPERFDQTVTALMGTGALIGLVAIPILNLILVTGGEASNLSFLWIVLIAWETAVAGHILRHAMDVTFITALGVALIYMYVSFAITFRVIKIITYLLR